jgi:hypothetical protein
VIAAAVAVPIALATGWVIAAGIPQRNTLYYAGVLDNGAGGSVDGPHDFTVGVFDAASAGNQVCSTTVSAVMVTAGNFRLPIDASCVAAIQANPELWVETSLDGTSLGRAKIGAVPYAIEAARASDAAGNLASAISNLTMRVTTLEGSGGTHPNPSVKFDSGWYAAPFRVQTSLPHGVISPDFVYGWVRGSGTTLGPLVRPAMGSSQPSFGIAYNQFGPTSFGFQNWDYLAQTNDPGDRANVVVNNGEMRQLVIQHAANWDSGWQACAANNTYTFLHNLGVYPTYVQVEAAENNDGSGWRVPTMTSSNFDGANWRQTSMVNLSPTTITIRTQTSLAYFYQAGMAQAPGNGFCRVRLYNWAPDFDSGWIAVNSAAPDRDKFIEHHLGQVPSMANLYVAQNMDGSGWAVIGLGSFQYSYSYGTALYSVGERYALVKVGASAIAHFVDNAGNGQGPTSGFIRLIAWR